MRKSPILALVIPAALIAGLLTLTIFLTTSSVDEDESTADPSLSFGPWRVPAGNASALALLDEATLQSREPLTIETDGVKVRIASGIRVKFLDDEAIVTTAAPIVVNGLTLTPDGNSQVALSPSHVRVIVGPILLDDGRWLDDEIIPYHELRIDPLPKISANGPATDSRSDDARSRHSTGIVRDAQNAAAIHGAHIVGTFSYSDDGYPPDPQNGSQVELTTDSQGRFTAPAFRPQDPRLYLHLTIDHPRYLPEVFVLEEPRQLDGSRSEVTVLLRPARTYKALFTDMDGVALAHSAIELFPDRALDDFVGEDTWDEGRALRKGKRRIAYTRSDGTLRFGPYRTTFVFLDPLRHLFDTTIRDVVGSVTLPPVEPESQWVQPFEVVAAAGQPNDYVVEDADGQRVTDTLIEIELHGMPAVRLSTDHDGGFAFAPWPFPGDLQRLSPKQPRVGPLTCLSPRMWKRHVEIAMPSREQKITMAGRLSGRLSLRTVRIGENGPVAIAPHDVRILDNSMTRVWWTPDGHVVFEGPLPQPKTKLTIFVRGHLPPTTNLPSFRPGTKELDLGEIVFDQGRTLSVRTTQEDGQQVRNVPLRFLISDYEASTEDNPIDLPFHAQRYPVDRESIAVGGLVRARRYRYALESGRWDDVAGDFLATEAVLETGLDVPLVRPPEEHTLLVGFLAGVDPERSHHFRVVERYSSERRGPISCASYPLPPTGSFGSFRRLHHRLDDPATTAEVFIIDTFGIEGARSIRSGRQIQRVFDMGSPTLTRLPYALFTFEGTPGHVSTPEDISLTAAEGRYHELAIISDLSRTLLLRNLVEGEYQLQWTSRGGPRESHRFEVRPDNLEIRATIPRRTGVREDVFVRIESESGDVVSGLQISLRDDSGSWRKLETAETVGVDLEKFQSRIPLVLERELVGPGYYVIPVSLRDDTTFRVSDLQERYLPVTVRAASGQRIPERLVLRTSAEVIATVLDVDGRPFTGGLRVEWAQVQREEDEISENDAEDLPVGITHGDPFTTFVDEAGTLKDQRFPTGRYDYIFRAESSEAKTRARLLLTPKSSDNRPNSIGELRLEESQAVRGVVRLPTGEVAARAVVALVDPRHAHRLPGRQINLRDQPYSTRADALGNFVIDSLPLDLGEDYALIAHLEGWTDAVENPADFTLEERILELGEDTELIVDVGYRTGHFPTTYEFRLAYSEEDGTEAEIVDLGPVEPTASGGLQYPGVTPGYYTLTWDLREPHPTAGARTIETFLGPGEARRLTLRISDTVCRGEAIFNGLPLELGWVLLTPDPADETEIRMGRVRDGTFETMAPTRTPTAYVALIPEISPIPEPNFSRGEALPVEYEHYRFDMKRGFLNVEYRAYNLSFELPAKIFDEYSEINVEFPHYEWSRTRFRRGLISERVEGPLFRLMLLPQGRLPLRFTSPDGFRSINDVEIYRDIEIRVRR